MSDGSLNLVRAIDPRVDVGSRDRRTYAVFQGGREVSYQRVDPDGGLSNSQLTFTVNPPSPHVFVNRRPMLTMTFDLTFTGVSAGAGIPLLQMAGATSSTGALVGTQFHDAPRAFPLANAMTNLTMTINNDSISQNLNQYIRALPRYSTCAKSQDINYGLTPSMLDQSISYADLDGFARDPLRGYGDNPLQVPRGGFVGIDVIQNDSTGVADTAVVRITCSEHLFLSPFIFQQDKQDTGFIGVHDLQLTLSLGGRGNSALAGLGSSLWSHSSASASVINTAAVQVVAADVLFSFISPDSSQVIPSQNFYSYYEPRLYPTQTFVPVVAGAQTTIQMNNVQLGTIPASVYLFVSERDSDHDFSKTDTFFNIDNVSITFDNRDNILANATEQDLYNIAKKNGTNLSWTQWTRETGSVIRLDFGEDIPLRSDQAAGLRGTYNFRCTLRCRNLSGAAVTPTLTCLMVAEGVMMLEDGRCTRSVGLLSHEDIMSDMPEITYVHTGDMWGGNFFQRAGQFFKRAGKFIKKYARPAIETARTAISQLAPEFLPEVEVADKVAKAFGLGYKPRGRGKGLVGGKGLTREQLALMLQQ